VPNSRGRKKKLPLGVVPMTPLVHQALLEQRNAFIEKFGREPGPDDPVFFDTDIEDRVCHHMLSFMTTSRSRFLPVSTKRMKRGKTPGERVAR